MQVMLRELNRRGFLSSMTSGTVAVLAVKARANPPDVPDIVIDCHAHVYGEDERAYPTIAKPYRPPAGKGSVAHLRREMTKNGVTHVTAIQTTTFYRFDNRFLADTALRDRDI